MAQDYRDWTIHRNKKGWPRWWQPAYEAWLVLTKKQSLHRAYQLGVTLGRDMEYERLIKNGSWMGEIKGHQNRPTIFVVGETGIGKTTVVFAIQTMLRERFKSVSAIYGDMSGTMEDKPADWEIEQVSKTPWHITEVTTRSIKKGA